MSLAIIPTTNPEYGPPLPPLHPSTERVQSKIDTLNVRQDFYVLLGGQALEHGGVQLSPEAQIEFDATKARVAGMSETDTHAAVPPKPIDRSKLGFFDTLRERSVVKKAQKLQKTQHDLEVVSAARNVLEVEEAKWGRTREVATPELRRKYIAKAAEDLDAGRITRIEFEARKKEIKAQSVFNEHPHQRPVSEVEKRMQRTIPQTVYGDVGSGNRSIISTTTGGKHFERRAARIEELGYELHSAHTSARREAQELIGAKVGLATQKVKHAHVNARLERVGKFHDRKALTDELDTLVSTYIEAIEKGTAIDKSILDALNTKPTDQAAQEKAELVNAYMDQLIRAASSATLSPDDLQSYKETFQTILESGRAKIDKQASPRRERKRDVLKTKVSVHEKELKQKRQVHIARKFYANKGRQLRRETRQMKRNS